MKVNTQLIPKKFKYFNTKFNDDHFIYTVLTTFRQKNILAAKLKPEQKTRYQCFGEANKYQKVSRIPFKYNTRFSACQFIYVRKCFTEIV